jgi:hypothetical protein
MGANGSVKASGHRLISRSFKHGEGFEMRNGKSVSLLVTILLFAGAARAADYCCTCKDEKVGKTIEASSRFSATGKCSVECGDLALVTSGKCAVPATAPAPAATGSGHSVMLFKSDDCSGDSARVSKSTPDLKAAGIDDIQSMSVESGGPAIGFEKSDFGGRGTGYMGPTICVSPGFEIQGVRIGGR